MNFIRTSFQFDFDLFYGEELSFTGDCTSCRNGPSIPPHAVLVDCTDVRFNVSTCALFCEEGYKKTGNPSCSIGYVSSLGSLLRYKTTGIKFCFINAVPRSYNTINVLKLFTQRINVILASY